jgi:hypothetical protein
VKGQHVHANLRSEGDGSGDSGSAWGDDVVGEGESDESGTFLVSGEVVDVEFGADSPQV